jgi:phage shock protein E
MKIAIRIAIVLLVSFASGIVNAADVAQIKPETLLERSAKQDHSLVILDVRTPEEFAAGHVPGAINIPHDKLESRIDELLGAKNKDVVLYCRSGRRAGLAAETLSLHGFDKLLHLEGDMQKWTEANRPIEK